MGNYFNLLKSTLDDLQLHNLPAQTWNLDETSLSIEPSKTKVVGGKGAVCSRVTSGPGERERDNFLKSQYSRSLSSTSYHFQGKICLGQWMASNKTNLELVYAASTNGWMEVDLYIPELHTKHIYVYNRSSKACTSYLGRPQRTCRSTNNTTC